MHGYAASLDSVAVPVHLVATMDRWIYVVLCLLLVDTSGRPPRPDTVHACHVRRDTSMNYPRHQEMPCLTADHCDRPAGVGNHTRTYSTFPLTCTSSICGSIRGSFALWSPASTSSIRGSIDRGSICSERCRRSRTRTAGRHDPIAARR